MSACCDGGCSTNALLEARQRRTLKAVLAINFTMFVVIVCAAIYSGSSAMLANSLDNFGDALTYLLSIYVVSRGVEAKAKVALFKGGLILLAALVITGEIIYKLIYPHVPIFGTMGLFGLLSLVANSLCLFLLWRHRNEDVNMSSVWECSRNDIASDLSIVVAAAGIWLFNSGWPDLVVAAALVILLYRSAYGVIRSARLELHHGN